MVGGFLGVKPVSVPGELEWGPDLLGQSFHILSRYGCQFPPPGGVEGNLALHCTQSVGLDMGGSNGRFSSQDVSDNPCRKDATSTLSSGRTP